MRAPAPLREGNGDARHGNEEAGHKEERVRAVLPEDSSPRNEVSERDRLRLHRRTDRHIGTYPNHDESPDQHHVIV